LRTPPTSTLFPYTTLFRSSKADGFNLNVVQLESTDQQDVGAALQKPQALNEGQRTSATSGGASHVAEIIEDLDATTGIPVTSNSDRKSTRLNSSHLVISYA